jgi:hypothetical protein
MPQKPIDYAALARQMGGAPVTDAAQLVELAKQFGGVPLSADTETVAPPTEPSFVPPNPAWGNQPLWDSNRAGMVEGAQRMGTQVSQNTVAPVKDVAGAAWQATTNPVDAAKRGAQWAMNLFSGMGQAQAEQLTKAEQAAASGDYHSAVLHGGAYLLPVVGPMLDDMVQRVKNGESAEVAGDLFTMFVLPELAKKSPAIRTPNMNRLNPVESEAMQFGLDKGLPITAGDATGNPALRTASQAAERMTISGGQRGLSRTNQLEEGLTTIGEQLAAKASATPQTLSGAGRSAVTGGQKTAGLRAAEARTEYNALSQLENADPARFAVDVRAAQQQLEPLYRSLLDDSQLVPLQGARADALLALNRLMKAPNTVSLSTADAALGDLKRIVRRQGRDQFSSGGRDLVEILGALEGEVTRAAQMDPAAIQALQAGRKATVARHEALDFVEDVVNRRGTNIAMDVIGRKDSGVELIRNLQKVSPDVVPEIGRAFLDDLIEQATAGGGFKGAQGILKTWQKMGPETKQALFADAIAKDAGYLKDLDNFFMLADRATRNMNTSGSAWTGGTAAHVLQMATFQDPMLSAAIEAGGYTASRLLSNPTVVRALSRGAAIPTSAKAAKAANAAAIYKALGLATAPARAQGAGPGGR